MGYYSGYRNYRGRRPRGQLLLSIVLVCVILAAIGVIVLQGYIVYGSDGTPHFRFGERSAPPAEGDVRVELTIQPADRQTKSTSTEQES